MHRSHWLHNLLDYYFVFFFFLIQFKRLNLGFLHYYFIILTVNKCLLARSTETTPWRTVLCQKEPSRLVFIESLILYHLLRERFFHVTQSLQKL